MYYWAQLWKWFADNKTAIDDIISEYPISEFPTATIEIQRKCFFKDYVMKKDFSEEKVYPVQTSDLKSTADLMLGMNKVLSFEGVPSAKGGSTAQK